MNRVNTIGFGCMVAVALFNGLAVQSSWAAKTWDNGNGDYLWSSPTNWNSNGLPTTSDAVNINGLSSLANPVLIASGSPAASSTLTIGNALADSGYLSIQDTLTLGSGTATPLIGNAGAGTVIHSAGTLAPGFGITLGAAATGVGSYTLSGTGILSTGSVNGVKIGDAGTGTFTQTGGSFSTSGSMILGNQTGSSGTYAMSGTGTLGLGTNQQLVVGKLGTGTFTIAGNAVTEGGTNFTNTVGVGSKIQGYGTFTSGNNAQASFVFITTNGKIIADGSGVDRTLAFVAGGAFGTANQLTANTVENTTDNGWYAQNHGKLTLSKIAMGVNGTVARAVTFAESAGDATLDLVNSARFSFTANIINGLADVSLLATDRTDVVAAPSGINFIGIWNLSSGPVSSFSAPSYQFRYDDALAGAATPTLYWLNAGSWTALTSSNDAINHILSTTDGNITTFNNTFAIGVAVPEPATLALLGLGLLTASGRRRNRQAVA